ncbi:MAG: hypothetical protein WCJ45_05515 [bacterium]
MIKSVYPKEYADHKKQVPIHQKPIQKDLDKLKQSLAVVVDGDALINYYFCNECKPKP